MYLLCMDLTIVLSTDVQNWHDYTLSNSLIEQLNVNRRTCHIAMKVVSDSFCSMVWLGATAVCAEVEGLPPKQCGCQCAGPGTRRRI
jgi:hypothetical protein